MANYSFFFISDMFLLNKFNEYLGNEHYNLIMYTFSCIADQEMMMHLYDLIDVDVIC